MKKFLLSIILFALCVGAFAQTATLTFTGRDTTDRWVRLHHVVITNQNQNWSETVAWPDTVLTIENGTGVYDVETGRAPSLQLFQNHPNPFNGTTDVLLAATDAGAVTLEIADVNGRIVETTHALSLPTGPRHQFRITLSATGTYVMSARQNGKTASIKMVNNGGGNDNRIEYAGIVETWCTASLPPKSHTRGAVIHPFDFGDVMEYAGYAAINGRMDTVIISQPLADSQEIVMTFEGVQTDGLPCPGIPTLTDINGNVYNTALIGSQLWYQFTSAAQGHHAALYMDGVQIQDMYIQCGINNGCCFIVKEWSSKEELKEFCKKLSRQ